MTKETEELKKGLLYIGGLINALDTPHVSYIALGIWVRIADNDSERLSARAIADRSPFEDEKAVLDALGELERAGLVCLERVENLDGALTTYARVDFGPGGSNWMRQISET